MPISHLTFRFRILHLCPGGRTAPYDIRVVGIRYWCQAHAFVFAMQKCTLSVMSDSVEALARIVQRWTSAKMGDFESDVATIEEAMAHGLWCGQVSESPSFIELKARVVGSL
jgi:hypothetical protein